MTRSQPAVRTAQPDPARPSPATRSGLRTWILDGTPARSPWRILAAIGAIGEAVAHIPVTRQHLSEAPYIGAGFVLLTIAGLLLAQLLLTADSVAVWIATLGVAALALAGYAISRTVGLPQIHDDIGNWTEPLGLIAIATEAIMLLTATAELAGRRSPVPGPRLRCAALTPAAAVLLVSCAASLAAPSTKPDPAPSVSIASDGASGATPSDAAKMICSDETRQNITTVLAVPVDNQRTPTWTDGTYTCSYHLAAGPIVLSVHESADPAVAATYSAALRQAMPDAKDLTGLTPTAFGTSNGVVVMNKDNDTLRVDTSGLDPRSGRLYDHRDAFAYEIATVILGCWTGDSG